MVKARTQAVASKSVDSVGEPESPYEAASSAQALLRLVDSNAKLSESNLSLARSHEKLVRMLEEKHGATGSAPAQTELIHQKQVSLILEALAKVGTGSRWKSIEEAYEELNIILADPLGGKSKAGSVVVSRK